MATTLSSLYQLGVDNALIQVPQNYIVPNNPPGPHNPPQAGDPAPNTNGTTADSVTLYLSAIQRFNYPLTLSFFIQRIDSNYLSNGVTVNPNCQVCDPYLTYQDGTQLPVNGAVNPIQIGTSVVSLVTGTWDVTNLGWKGFIYDDLGNPFTLQANNGNALNTYTPTNYVTLWINPNGVGGNIDPNFPPSYLITIQATDLNHTNTFATCNFTLVVNPSIAGYGMGVFAQQLPTSLLLSNAVGGSTTCLVNDSTLLSVGDQICFYDPANTSSECFDNPVITGINGSTITFNNPLLNTYRISNYAFIRDVIHDGIEPYVLGYVNHVTMKPETDPSGNFPIDTWYKFYPTETSNPANGNLPANIIISVTVDGQLLAGNSASDTFIDMAKSYVYGGDDHPWPEIIPLKYYGTAGNLPSGSIPYGNPHPSWNGIITITGGEGASREVPTTPVYLHLEYSGNSDTSYPTPFNSLIEITGTDSNGVSASAYTVVTSTTYS